MKKILLSIVFLIFCISCSDNDDRDTTTNFRGKVISNGIGIEGAEVSLVNDINSYAISTYDNGKFVFQNIEHGTYKLRALKEFDDNGLYVEKNEEVTINQGDQSSEFLLPQPADWLPPLEVSNTYITLNWGKYEQEDFGEYKVYRSTGPALDDEQGQLIYTSTNRNDTTFKDDQDSATGGLYPNNDYYYRVYVMDDKGKLGGSSILKVRTKEFSNEINVFYEIKQAINFAVEKDVNGIEFDGEYLWILYTGGELVKYDFQNNENLIRLSIDGEFQGLAYDGRYLWTNLRTNFDGKMFQIDPKNGEVVKNFGFEPSVDITYLNGYLYTKWRFLNKIDPSNGGIISSFERPFPNGNWGIASRDGELWLNSFLIDIDKIAILNEQGNHFAIAYVSEEEDNILSNGERYRMCFMNNQLVLSRQSRIYIYDIEKISK